MKNSINTLVVLSVLASPALAQVQARPVSDAGFAASLSGVRTTVAETRARQQAGKPQPGDDDLDIHIDPLGPADQPSSQTCEGAAALEKSRFMLSYSTERGELHLGFTYAGCKEEGRNDYLPPYVERYYKAPGGYSMVLVTDEGADASSVVVSFRGEGMKNPAIWTYGSVANSKLTASGNVDLGEVETMDYREPGRGVLKAKAKLGVQADAAAAASPDLKACEASLAKSLGSFKLDFGHKGFGSVGYSQSSALGVALVLQTKAEAYFYYESCDICADIDKCDLKTGTVTSFVHAHSAGCSDLAGVSRAGVVFDSCK